MATGRNPSRRASVKSPTGKQPERLAIYGGTRAVTVRHHERWRNVTLADRLQVLRHLCGDIKSYSTAHPIVQRFEGNFANLTGSRYALAMNSGTASLHSAYFAVGVGPGDEVIVPSYTFFASAAPILQLGARPVFCEINPETLTADPDDVERRINPQTRAICVVHVWGNPALMDRFADISQRHGVAVIEDCSHAHGAMFRDKPVGSWGDIGCFSLQGEKPVSGGEAGIAVTDDPELFDRMLVFAHFPRPGTEQKTKRFNVDYFSFGLKYRPHVVAILLAQGNLTRLEELNRLRRRNLEILANELAGFSTVRTISSYPQATPGGLLEFILKFDRESAGGWSRGAFAAAARAEGVPIAIDRYKPLHKQALFASTDLTVFGKAYAQSRPVADHLPITEQVCETTLTMPPLTRVRERFVRECARALRKVALGAAHMQDLRYGN